MLANVFALILFVVKFNKFLLHWLPSFIQVIVLYITHSVGTPPARIFTPFCYTVTVTGKPLSQSMSSKRPFGRQPRQGTKTSRWLCAMLSLCARSTT